MIIRAQISTSPLLELNRQLVAYQQQTGKTVAEVLHKKGRDLGIQLYKLYRAHMWGGPGENRRLALAELAARTPLGLGTRVRPQLLAEYKSLRRSLPKTALQLGLLRSSRTFNGTLGQWESLRNQQVRLLRTHAGLWRTTVRKEINLRQRSRGGLAVAFHGVLPASSTAYGKYLVRSSAAGGRTLGYVEKAEGFVRIVGLLAGHRIVNQRYDIATRALQAVTADTRQYLLNRQRDAFWRTFGIRIT